jgi:protein TonB
MFNNSSNLYNREWLALVFANRNKSYGAYYLRSHSSNNMLKAFLIAAPLFVGVFVAPKVLAKFGDKQEITAVDPIDPVQIVEVKPTVVEPKIEVEPVAAKKMEQPKIKTVGFTNNIKVVPDDKVTATPPTTEDLESNVISSITQDGLLGRGNIIIESIDGAENGLVGGTGIGNGDKVVDVASVDVYPEFPGGMEAWTKFIQKNLRYPPMAQEGGVQGKVFLSFVVEKDGMITDVKVLKGIGAGCDEEAMRVIKKSPRWRAGMQSNLPVRVRYQMPIAYMINN